MVAQKLKLIQNQLASHMTVELCRFAFKTPFPYLKTPGQMKLIKQAKDFFYPTRNSFYTDLSLGYTLHLWNPRAHAPKILITHGWMSRALYMSSIIKTFVEQGYEVHAMDFPAHGEGKGLQLEWINATKCILDCQKKFGPYDFAIGHSFGGTMILSAESAYKYVNDIHDKLEVDKVALMGSPVRIATPIRRFSKAFKLKPEAEELFIRTQIEKVDKKVEHIDELDGKLNVDNTKSHYLVIHDTDDPIIPFDEALYFCQDNQKATLHKTSTLGHVKPLYDESIMNLLRTFLA